MSAGHLTQGQCIGSLIGGALGDTLGMPVETWTPAQIRKYVGTISAPIAPFIVLDRQGKVLDSDADGRLRYWGRDFSLGEYTDDTILTLAIARSIADLGRVDAQDATMRQVEEYRLRKQDDGSVRGGFGGTTKSAFERILSGTSALESGILEGPGNAPPMKMGPIGLYMARTEAYHEGIEAARTIGMATHLDPRSVAAGIAQAHAVYFAAHTDNHRLIDSVLDVVSKYEAHADRRHTAWEKGSLLDRLTWVRENAHKSDEEAYHFLGNGGFVLESYPFTIFMAQRYWDSPIEGMLATVNMGGDCDTTGAMYGTIMGARHGNIWPASWQAVLEGRSEIADLGARIARIGGDCDEQSPGRA
ncbi:MAG: ADP-ribosylglycohydrolase family protein [Nanoarchaeota archaeon]